MKQSRAAAAAALFTFSRHPIIFNHPKKCN